MTAMVARFHAPDAAAAGEIVSLPDDEAQHLMRVLRLRQGASVRVFDGRGREFDALVDTTGKGGVTVRLGVACEPAPEPRVAVTLAQAVLKGEKMDAVVRDAVMLGVTAIQPIVTARTEVTLAALTRARRRDRWARIAVSSAKQSGRAVVPTILEPVSVDALFVRLSAPAGAELGLLCAEPSASAGATRLTEINATPPRRATLVIGPEGGWTAGEIERAAGCLVVTLGARTLRADTVAVVALSALFAVWKEF